MLSQFFATPNRLPLVAAQIDNQKPIKNLPQGEVKFRRLPDWVLPQAGPPRVVGFSQASCLNQLSAPNRLPLVAAQIDNQKPIKKPPARGG